MMPTHRLLKKGVPFGAILFACLLFTAFSSLAQESPKDSVVETDLPTLLFKKKKETIVDSAMMITPQGKIKLAVLPVVGYNPANGFVFGAAISGSTMLGNPATTRQSSGLINATLTTKEQMIIIGRAGLAFEGNKYLVDIDTRLLIFTQDTYGLGTKTGKEGASNYAQAQPMTFNYFRFFLNGYRRISDELYAGAGIAIENHSKIVDVNLNIDSVPFNYTSHYNYSTQHGFPLTKYKTNGLFLAIKWDSRDNIANPYTGWFASMAGNFNMPWLGSNKSSFMFNLDGRYYLNVQKSRPSHLVAFWLRGNFSTEGKIPYLALPATSWDTYNRTGRGYIQGRFRGPAMAYFETEYRYPITRNGLLGGVAFANFTSTSGNGQKLFEAVAPAAGVGLRIKLDKASRANITVDYARGAAGSSGIFFNLQEAF
ncbi:MAG TPA: BamA/TamA family outer membrane protein [Phnomibacter sp.]|nr:BamA/TamA family outer membrane protein [Phnomibacter sp.]